MMELDAENSCKVCPFMNKELNKLRRMVCLLQAELNNSCDQNSINQYNDKSTQCDNIHMQSNNNITFSDNCAQTDSYAHVSSLSLEQSCETKPTVGTEKLALFHGPFNSLLANIDQGNDTESLSSSRGTPTNLNLTHDSLNVFSYDIENNEVVEPYSLLPGSPLSKFKLSDLEHSTIFSQTFGNRLTAHYGETPYSYAGVTHQPCPISSNEPLNVLLTDLGNVLPSVKFNSVLITKYLNGTKHLPYHSDNESEICDDSEIVTISLGQARSIKFRAKSTPDTELSVNLSHGQVFTMTKKSQSHFEHCIPKDYSKHPRISITLRYLMPSSLQSIPHIHDITTPTEATQQPQARIISNQNIATCTPHTNTNNDSLVNHQSKPVTLYISSSMFRHLEADKLTSTTQDAHVFFYPGATAGKMLTRFQQDPKAGAVNSSLVRKVLILTGSNNVDEICQDNSGVVFERTTCEIAALVSYLRLTFAGASINLMNVLPRVNYQRNVAINRINNYLQTLSCQHEYIFYINTEFNRNLFSNTLGFRKNFYFMPASSSIPDNVHLNRTGIIRLAKHLKYVAHNM